MQRSESIKNLSLKMLKVMKDVEYIKKTGVNDFHKYKYAKESDVIAAFSKSFKEHGVFLFCSVVDRSCVSYKTRGGKDSFLVTIKMESTFVDSESGEYFTVQFYGDGSDSDDKGIYQALTGAQKYLLMKTFLVETGDDPERDDRAAHKELEKKEGAPLNNEDRLKILEKSARRGSDAFNAFYKLLSKEDKEFAKENNQHLKDLMLGADKLMKDEAI